MITSISLRGFALRIVTFFLLFAGLSGARAAVAQLGSPGQINNNTTLSFTVPAGTNRLLVVNASGSDLNNLTNITGVTFNGTPMTLGVKRDDGSVAVDSLWYLPMGTNLSTSTPGTIVATVTGGSMTALGAVTFQGVDQSTPMNGAQSAILTANNAGSSLNITSTTGDLVMDLFDIYDPTGVGTETPGGGQTVIHDIDAPAGSLFGYYKTSTKAGAASVTMSWTSNGQAMIQVAANIKQGVAATLPTMSLPTSASVTTNSATLGGTVISDGGATITERGVVASPTALNNNPLIGGGNVLKFTTTGTTGAFTVSATGLSTNTGYTYKAYAMNSQGVAYTSVATFSTLALPNLSINNVFLGEGNSGTTSFTFTVSLSAAAPPGGVTFDIATADSTATAPGDYTAKSLTGQTIPAGSSTYSFTVLVNGDTIAESDENFQVNVTNVTGANVLSSQGGGVILNDDVPPQISSPTVTGVTASGATLGGNATGNGSATISERGVVYALTSTNGNPQIGGLGVTKISTAGTTGVFTVPVSGLAASSGYSFAAYATNVVGTSYTSPVSTFTTAVGNSAPTDITLTNASIPENNTAGATIGTLGAVDPDAGQTQTFALVAGSGATDNGAFTITGTTLSINGVADFETQSSYSIRVRATDNGAPPLSFDKVLTITITNVTIPQTITFGPLGPKTFGDPDFTVSATGGGGPQPVTFGVTGPATLTGNLVHLTGAGSVIITASQAGSGDYSAATPVPQSFTVAKAAQTITFSLPASAAQSDTLTLSATGGASGNPVTFGIVSGPGSITGNTLSFTGPGDVVVSANQAGNPNYLAATEVDATVHITTTAGLTLADDAVTVTGADATLYPLANDSTTNAGPLNITAVSNPAVTVSGRALIVPPGTADFTYSVSDGTANATANVTVLAANPVSNPSRFNGLLRDSDGAIVGWAKVTISPRGFASAQVRVGAISGSGKFTFHAGDTTGSGTTKVGAVSMTLNQNGTVDLAVTAASGPVEGSLRAARGTGPAENLHVALASIDAAIPGGGFATLNVKSSGLVTLFGQLPDGRPFTASSEISDNGTIALFAMENKGVLPPGQVGGELTHANLTATDVTGDFAWGKPQQSPGAKGQDLGGVSTVLTANGCLYNGAITLAGGGTLTLSGGNLAAEENSAVTITAGIPKVPTGSLVGWAGVKASIGKFRVRVKVPGITRPVTGGGVYLPKSHSAWGYFPGTTVGGRIELTIP